MGLLKELFSRRAVKDGLRGDVMLDDEGAQKHAEEPAHEPAGSAKGGQFTSGSGGEGSASDKGAKKAPTSPREQWERECQEIDRAYDAEKAEYDSEAKRIDSEHAAAVKQYELDHAEWESATKAVDDKYEADQAAWEERDGQRDERVEAVSAIAQSSPFESDQEGLDILDIQSKIEGGRLLETSEGRETFRERAGAWAEAIPEAFDSVTSRLVEELTEQGAPEKGVAKVKEIGARFAKTIEKPLGKYVSLLDSEIKAREEFDAVMAEEPQGDSRYTPDGNEDSDLYKAWDEKSKKLNDKWIAAESATQDAYDKVNDIWLAHKDQIDEALTAIDDSMEKHIAREAKGDPEPKDPPGSAYPDEPEAPEDLTEDDYPPEPDPPTEDDYPEPPDEDEEPDEDDDEDK